MASGVATGGHFFAASPAAERCQPLAKLNVATGTIRSLKRNPLSAGSGIKIQRVSPTRFLPVTTSSFEKQLPEQNIDLRFSQHNRVNKAKFPLRPEPGEIIPHYIAG